MSSIASDVLAAWADRWRYPELLVRLADADRPLSRDELARLIVHGIANQTTPAESIRVLTAAGEFAVAERLLDAPDVAALLGAESAELADELAAARSEADSELHTRLLALRSRAAEVGVSGVPDGLEGVADARRHEGDVILAQWEAEVAIKERDWERRIRDRLAEVAGDAGDGESEHLTRSVEACLMANQLRAAEYLLRHPTRPTAAEGDAWPAAVAGPLTASAHDIAAAAPWPWHLPIGEVLVWYERPDQAPPDFHARWQATDTAAVEVVAAIRELAATGEPTARLCAAVDRATGCAPGSGQTLQTTADPLLAPLAFFEGRALPVRGPDDDAKPALVIGATPVDDSDSPWITATDLLQILGRPADRRVHLLRLIAGQLPLAHAVIPERAAALPPMTPIELRLYVDWILDLLDVPVNAVFADVLTGLAAGFVQPALVLLDDFLSAAGTRTEIADVAALHEVVLASGPFWAACKDAVFGPLADAPPLTRAVLTILAWYDPTGAEPQSLFGVGEVLALAGVECDDDAALAATVWRLKGLSLVEETDAGYCVYPDVARLLRTLVPDIDAYVAAACPSYP